MSQKHINDGTVANDHSGTNWRTAWGYVEDNFTDLYAIQSRTVNAGDVRFLGGATNEARIQLAINQAVVELAARVYVPAFMLPYDASLVTFNASVQMVREGGNAASWDVLAYGAVGATWPSVPTTDSTVAIQAAIASGHDVDFVGLCYVAHTLTQTADKQVFYSSVGVAHIIKNANGDLFTSTGASVQCHNIEFRGDAATPVFTGNNVVSTGGQFSMINCGSRYAYARALKATGDGVTIMGSQEIYHTADATATGYDIELGVSGIATLYHKIIGIRTNQPTGGLLFIDTGAQSVVGCSFGKLTTQNGTGPAGVNGGLYSGNRILGNVTLGISNAEFAANAFAIVNVVIGAGVTGIHINESNSFQVGSTLTNNGGASSPLVRSVGAAGVIRLKYGDDASLAVVDITPNSGRVGFPQKVATPNNTGGYVALSTTGTDGLSLYIDASDVVWLNNTVTNKSIVVQVLGASGFIGEAVNGAYIGKWLADSLDIQSGKVLKVAGTQVVSARGAAVADATDAASVILRLNDLLARCRAHGLIAP